MIALFVAAATALLPFAFSPTLAAAQQPAKARVAWLAVAPHPLIEPFREGLRALGYVEGQNIEISFEDAEGRTERLDELAGELLRRSPDVIVVSGAATMRAAHRVVKSVPVVFVASDPIGQGVVASLARPDGNLTGLALPFVETSVKWLELAGEIVPASPAFAVLTDRAGAPGQFEAMQQAAGPMGRKLIRFDVSEAAEIENAFLEARTAGVGAMIVISSPSFAAQRHEIVASAARHRMPTIYEHRGFVEIGGLISYGPDLNDVFRRAATYVDRILKGTKPGALPIEQPSKFETVLNLRTARSLGLSISDHLASRADEVIE